MRKKAKSPTILIKKGDVVDISRLLFTKKRDYLTKGSKQKVKAEQLAGKTIVLYFLNLSTSTRDDNTWRRDTLCLEEIYNEIHPKGCMEVIFIPFRTTRVISNYNYRRLSRERFSLMPWAAIPFWDHKSRKYLAERFCRAKYHAPSFVIDPIGLVLQCDAIKYFHEYGAAGYPFTDKKINLIISEDDAARQHLSITKLLVSPERDYLISNNGDQVAVSDLEDKVVALYFFYDKDPNNSDDNTLTSRIKMVYRELANKEENFEVVLIYVHDTVSTSYCTTEVTFQKRFSTMPWLALPFKDPLCKKLQRIVKFPQLFIYRDLHPSLVIIGPHGNFCERFGVDILLNYGVAAYPFTRKTVVKLEAEKAKRLKLEMFWRDPNTIFRQRDGRTVRFSQLVGKKTIHIFGPISSSCVDFFKMLAAKYHQMKGTSNEFDVIHISSNMQGPSSVKGLPWLTHPTLASQSNECKLLLGTFGNGHGLLAFDSDGRLVCKTTCPSFKREDADFPFHAHSLEWDTRYQLLRRFSWFRWRGCFSYDDDDLCFYTSLCQ